MTPFEPTKPRPEEQLSDVWRRLFNEIVEHYRGVVEEMAPKPLKASVTYQDNANGSEIIAINGHEIQYGGPAGDGFCYSHQSFDCELTDEERTAVVYAEEPDHGPPTDEQLREWVASEEAELDQQQSSQVC